MPITTPFSPPWEMRGSRLHHWLTAPHRCPLSPGRGSEPPPTVAEQSIMLVRFGTSPKRRIFASAWRCWFAANFGELRQREVRRTRLLGTWAKLFRLCRTRPNPATSVRRSMPEDRGFAYATCCSQQQLVARQGRGRGFGIVYCLRTADKAPDTNTEVFIFLQDLQEKRRADERTRTADLLITSDPSSVAGVCTRLQNPYF